MPIKLNAKSDRKGIVQPIVYHDIKDLISYYRSSISVNDKEHITSCWIGLEELQALIADNKDTTGIRLYFGRHRLSTSVDSRLDKKGFHTIIFVTTKSDDPAGIATMENSKDQLNYDPRLGEVNSVSYTGTGADNVPTKPPYPNPSSSLDN